MNFEDTLLIDRLIDATDKGMIEWVDHQDVSMVGFFPPRPNDQIMFELYPGRDLCLIVDNRNVHLIDLTDLSLGDAVFALGDLVARRAGDPEVARRLRVQQASATVLEVLNPETRDAHPSNP